MADSDDDNYLLKINGLVPTGAVTLRDFDQGVVETLGGVVVDDPMNATGYYLKDIKGIDIDSPLPDPNGFTGGVSGPAGFAGIPIVFSYPEDTTQKYKLPMVMIRRDGIDPALSRWHPSAQQYRAPAVGANKVGVNIGSAANPNVRYGYDRTVTSVQAMPYDLTYTIRVISKFRGQTGKSNHVNALLMHILKVYGPYTSVLLTDSLGDVRSYEAFGESIGTSDEGFEIADRVLGFDVSLRIEGELDIYDPVTSDTLISLPSFSFTKS
jgi:hypothetical protein